ncbi:hypothetical protein ACFWXA_29415 [Streptomyces atroolivaceus]|uniref:hypothetical protein n=1 Tax=Streptomyces atroolivaceus TaxID=66869 RepID=UPI00365AA8D9
MVILGQDSLDAAQLQQRLRSVLRIEMKPGTIWVKPSASTLTDWLLDHTGISSAPGADGLTEGTGQ